MQSHCLRHQDRVATKRCSSCSIPLCDSCAEPHPDGVFCSEKCHQSAQDAKARAALMAKEEAELRQWRQKRAAIRMILYVGVAAAIFVGWDHLPEALTGPVESLWKAMTGAAKSK